MNTRILSFIAVVALLHVGLARESHAENTMRFTGAVVVSTVNVNAASPTCGQRSLVCPSPIRYHATDRRLTADESDRVLRYLHDYVHQTGGHAAERTLTYD